jgi:hypothetical protein
MMSFMGLSLWCGATVRRAMASCFRGVALNGHGPGIGSPDVNILVVGSDVDECA